MAAKTESTAAKVVYKSSLKFSVLSSYLPMAVTIQEFAAEKRRSRDYELPQHNQNHQKTFEFLLGFSHCW
jgi:hypothetical protein